MFGIFFYSVAMWLEIDHVYPNIVFILDNTLRRHTLYCHCHTVSGVSIKTALWFSLCSNFPFLLFWHERGRMPRRTYSDMRSDHCLLSSTRTRKMDWWNQDETTNNRSNPHHPRDISNCIFPLWQALTLWLYFEGWMVRMVLFNVCLFNIIQFNRHLEY